MVHRRRRAQRAIVAPLLTSLVTLILVACGSGGPGVPGATAARATGAAAAGQTEAAGPGSGVKARIVNLYVPAKGEPAPVDVYLKPFALEGDTPALSVPFGQIGAWLDPDPDGDTNVFMSVYRPGETGNGNAVMSWTETVAEGDVMTFLLATGESTDDAGNRLGQLQTFDHGPAGQLPAPSAGNALLVANTLPLENVVPDVRDNYLFLSTGQGCLAAYDDTADSHGLLGRQLSYEIPSATKTVSIHEYSSETSGFPDCANTALLADVPVTLASGWPVVLVVYAPKADDYRTILVPLEP